MGQQAQEIGHRLGEGHLQGMVIDGLHPERIGGQLPATMSSTLSKRGELGEPGESGGFLGSTSLRQP